MSERVYARQLDKGLWQWRLMGETGEWVNDVYHTGDATALTEAMPKSTTPINMALIGSEAVACEFEVEGKAKKHLAKILPFELEDKIIDPVEELHFAFTLKDANTASVLYLRDQVMEDALAELLTLKCDVQQCLPDYLMLLRVENGATILYEDDMVLAHLDNGKGFAVEADLAPRIFADIAEQHKFTSTLNLVAENAEQLSKLRSWLPEAWLESSVDGVTDTPEDANDLNPSELNESDVGEVDASELADTENADSESADINAEADLTESDDGSSIETQSEVINNEGGYWAWVDTDKLTFELNLRSGKFSRQLPFERWWKMWKIPSYVAAAAFVAAVMVTYVEYLSLASQQKTIREEIRTVFLKAVPKGRKGDEERQLVSLLKTGNTKTGQPTNLMALLGNFGSVMDEHKGITLSSFRYNGEQRQLQVNIEAKTLDDISRFKRMLSAKGLEPGSPRSTKKGDVYQSRMQIVEK
ncbi:MAG: hypothetical protein COA42_10500 [Alteromonadaceae bacterium]|nr:MAG: hypothetical protein COA42_10500 [Alteromonadaceae bacterium]